MARTSKATPPAAGLSVTLDRAELLPALAGLAKVVESRVTIPILSHVLIQAEGSSVTLTGTDLDIQWAAVVPAEVSEAFTCTVSAQSLHDIARKLPKDSKITLAFNPERVAVVVKAGRAQFLLPGYPAEDFPHLNMNSADLAHSTEIAATIVADMLTKTSFAISTEETRYYLNGIYCHVVTDGAAPCLRFVATDGHRLARVETPHASGLDPAMPGVIIPRKAVHALKYLTGEGTEANLQIEFSRTIVRITRGAVVITSKLIEGTFPDYQKIVPDNSERPAVVAPTLALSMAAERVGTVSLEKGRGIKISLSTDKLSLSLRNNDGGEGSDEIDVEYSGEPFEIGFNSKYLAEMIPLTGGDTVTLRLGIDPGAPILISHRENASALWVLMPMRV